MKFLFLALYSRVDCILQFYNFEFGWKFLLLFMNLKLKAIEYEDIVLQFGFLWFKYISNLGRDYLVCGLTYKTSMLPHDG